MQNLVQFIHGLNMGGSIILFQRYLFLHHDIFYSN